MNREAVSISTAFDPPPAGTLDIVPHRTTDGTDVDTRSALPIVPDRIAPPSPRREFSATPGGILAALSVNMGFAAIFLALLNWRDLPAPPERAIPVEIVASMPEISEPKPVEPPKPAEPPVTPPAPPPPPPPVSSPAVLPPTVAPPPEPAPAPPKSATEKPPLPTPPVPTPENSPPAKPAEAAPAEGPPVIASPKGEFSVSPPAPPTSKPPAEAAAPKTPKPDPSAVLAQALPMDTSLFPTTFQSVLNGLGTLPGGEYKGLVFARLARSQGARQEAHAHHLRGQVVVTFSVSADGRARGLKILQSSGTAALDALGLQMVREAEPFPPPPPGLTETFTPSLEIGEE